MLKNKSFIAKFLIIVMVLGTVGIPVNSNNIQNVQASTLVEIKDIPIGSLVVDNTWQWEHRTGNGYTGNGLTKSIEWIKIADNHFKKPIYQNINMLNHSTLLANESIGKRNFNYFGSNLMCGSYPCGSPWNNIPVRNEFLRSTFYNAMSSSLKNRIVPTTTTTSQYGSADPVITHNETVFFLSSVEVGFSSWSSHLDGSNRNGERIEFFPHNNSWSIIRSISDISNNYWLRDVGGYPVGDGMPTGYVGYVYESGFVGTTGQTNENIGLRPTINISADTKVRPTGQWKTSQAGQLVQIYEIVYNQSPTLSLSSPSNNRDLSEVPGYNVLTIGGQVHDPDVGDVVTLKYTIDGITAHTNRTLLTYTSNGGARTFSQGVPIDSTIPQGTYTLRVWAEDNKGGISPAVTRTIIVDKTKPTIQANPTYWLDFGLAELDITVNLSDNLSGIEERMYRVTKSEETPTTWTAAPSNSFNIKLEEQGDWYLHVRVRDKAGNERTERFGKYRLMTEIPPPFGWGDEDLEPIKLPDDFDPDNMNGKIVEFNGKKAMVVVGRYLHLSAKDIDYATHYAISLDGYGYSHWKPLRDGGFEESIFINTPGLYPVHLKLKNAQYNVESDPFVRNFLVDWIKPEISSQTKIKGQTATTNGQLVIKATGEDNLTPVLYNAGNGWRWFTSGQDITITGIPINNRRNNVVVRFSDINGNVTEELYQIWGLSN